MGYVKYTVDDVLASNQATSPASPSPRHHAHVHHQLHGNGERAGVGRTDEGGRVGAMFVAIVTTVRLTRPQG